jgi:hypothetical protein
MEIDYIGGDDAFGEDQLGSSFRNLSDQTLGGDAAIIVVGCNLATRSFGGRMRGVLPPLRSLLGRATEGVKHLMARKRRADRQGWPGVGSIN